MGISGSDKSQLYAIAGLERAGASRADDTLPRAFVSIGGVTLAQGSESSLTVVEELNEASNTARVTAYHGATEPVEGQNVVITLGSINNRKRTFAGSVINRSHTYVGMPANWNAQPNFIDYTWQLSRRRFSGSFTNMAPSAIAAAIVAVVPGFTLWVEPGLPTLAAFSQTDVSALEALTALAKASGAYCDVDYNRLVKLFATSDGLTAPTDLTSAHVSLEEFSFFKDFSRTRTRIYSEGGGVTALTQINPGETILPLSTVAWYNAAGGTVKSGAQHITYAGKRDSGGGSLVGPGAAPASAPALALASGTGLSAGGYKYAYTDVTASGESIPSPLASVTTLAVVAPPVNAPRVLSGSSSGSLTPGATYRFKVTYSTISSSSDHSSETTGSPSGSGVANATGAINFIPDMSGVLDPAVLELFIYRTVAGGSTFFLDRADVPANALAIFNGPGFAYVSTRSDANLVTQPAEPVSNTTPPRLQVSLSGIAIGASPTTSRKVYRTAVGGSQLKLLTTIANNTATTFADSTADGSLGANAPTSDTSAITQPTGQVLAGATSLLVAGAGGFSSTGGWALIQGGQVIRYAGITGNTLTGVPASGIGAIIATVAYNSTIVDAPALTGIPASGHGSVVYTILQGDQVNLLVQVDDLAAQAALATILSNDGIVDDGIIEDYISDGTIGETEARARATALLALKSTAQVTIRYKCRDKNTHAGALVTVNFGAPTNLAGQFRIQHVTISRFLPGMFPLREVEASNDRFSLENLLRMVPRG